MNIYYQLIESKGINFENSLINVETENVPTVHLRTSSIPPNYSDQLHKQGCKTIMSKIIPGNNNDLSRSGVHLVT